MFSIGVMFGDYSNVDVKFKYEEGEVNEYHINKINTCSSKTSSYISNRKCLHIHLNSQHTSHLLRSSCNSLIYPGHFPFSLEPIDLICFLLWWWPIFYFLLATDHFSLFSLFQLNKYTTASHHINISIKLTIQNPTTYLPKLHAMSSGYNVTDWV